MIKKSAGIFLILTSLLLPFSAAQAVEESALKDQIDSKTKELEAVNKQIQETQGVLDQTASKGKTLKQEVDTIDKSIKTVTLGIKQSEILLDKFGLEIKSLGGQIIDNEQSLGAKKQAMQGIFQSLQANDNQSVLLSLLNNKSFTDTFLEFQSLTDLNGELLVQLDEVRDLKAQLLDKQNQVTQKKSSTEAERATLKAKQSIAEDQKAARAELLAQTKNQEKIYQQQLDALEERQQAIIDEIADFEASLRADYNPSQLPGKRTGVLGWPLDTIRITQKYGATEFAKSNGKYYPKGTHNGMDLGAPLGTPVYAAEDGTITLSSKNGTAAERYYYGKFILIKHANNLSTLYGHLSRQAVVTGQVVKKGEIIGYVGKTGYATGYHLHFGVFLSASIQIRSVAGAGLIPAGYTLDPQDYLPLPR